MPTSNPFIYSVPVDHGDFVGREKEIRAIVDFLSADKMISSQIIGEPSMGKSSLLIYLKRHGNNRYRKRREDRTPIFVHLDCTELRVELSPAPIDFESFWRAVFQKRLESPFACLPDSIASEIENIGNGQDEITFRDLRGLLTNLGNRAEHNLVLVLLIDAFTELVQNEESMIDNLNKLFVLASGFSDMFALVVAGRKLASCLWDESGIQQMASPLYELLHPVYLGPFTDREVGDLIETYLDGTGVTFVEEDYDYIRRFAGTHPHLVQMAAYYLFEAYMRDLEGTGRFRFLDENLAGAANPYRRDLWDHRGRREREFLGKLALHRRGGFKAGWYEYKLREPSELLSSFQRERRELLSRGVVAKEDGELRMFAPRFSEWIVNEELRRRNFDEYEWLKECEGPSRGMGQFVERIKEPNTLAKVAIVSLILLLALTILAFSKLPLLWFLPVAIVVVILIFILRSLAIPSVDSGGRS